MHHRSAREWLIAAAAAALVLVLAPPVASPLAAQQAPAAAPPRPPAAPAPDSAAPVRRSRFGRFGRVFEKAVSTASDVGAKAGISKQTAARLAVTAATGGGAAALVQARLDGASSAATLATRGLAATAAPRPTPPAVSNALGEQAMHAMTDLGQISARAQQHDPAAVHALQVVSAEMAKPTGEFAALQHRASGGDPTAAQEILIREDAIARAALDGRAP